MLRHDFTTVMKILDYVKPRVDTFRQFPAERDYIVRELSLVFDTNATALAIVVKDGIFVESFQRSMGKGRMRALKILLYSIDETYYTQIDFRV